MPLLRRFFGVDAAVRDSQLRAEAARAVEGLDIDGAIASHCDWKRRLRAQLMPHDGAASQAPIDREEACSDERCELGRWIHGRGRARLGTFPGFAELMAHHRMFHHVASNVLTLQAAGKHVDARRMLDDQFEDYSDRVTEELRLLQQVIAETAEPRV